MKCLLNREIYIITACTELVSMYVDIVIVVAFVVAAVGGLIIYTQFQTRRDIVNRKYWIRISMVLFWACISGLVIMFFCVRVGNDCAHGGTAGHTAVWAPLFQHRSASRWSGILSSLRRGKVVDTVALLTPSMKKRKPREPTVIKSVDVVDFNLTLFLPLSLLILPRSRSVNSFLRKWRSISAGKSEK